MYNENMNKVIYIHGWGSSGEGETATLLKALVPGLIAPSLDYYNPSKALSDILALVDDRDPTDDVYIIASSLGGYFAEMVANLRVVHAILYNPSLRPATVSRIDPVVMKKMSLLPLGRYPTAASTRTVVLCSDDDVVSPDYATSYFGKYDVVWTTGGHRMTDANATLIVSMLNTRINRL